MTMAGHSRWKTTRARQLAGDQAAEHAEYTQARLDLQLGDMVRNRRRELGLSQKKVAESAGITQPALSRIEGGGGVPTLAMLDRIGKAMHTVFTFTVGETVRVEPAPRNDVVYPESARGVRVRYRDASGQTFRYRGKGQRCGTAREPAAGVTAAQDA